jgi:hypothetical protein
VTWHEAHDDARAAASGAAIPAHARLETYSVLTRLPPPHRLEATLVAHLLDAWFPADRALAPSAALGRELVRRCADAGVQGGAVYDALVGLSVAEAGGTLLTRDHRATRTYRRPGVTFDVMG